MRTALADLGKVLRAVHEILLEPIAQGDSDSVQAQVQHLVEVGLVDPSPPVSLEVGVRSTLALVHDAVELGLLTGAASVAPFG
jgi:hypothetical protein